MQRNFEEVGMNFVVSLVICVVVGAVGGWCFVEYALEAGKFLALIGGYISAVAGALLSVGLIAPPS